MNDIPERKYLGQGQGHIDLHTKGSTHDAALFTIDEARVARVIVGCLGVEANKVTRESSFESLGADSLDVIDITFQIEEEFAITLPDDKAESIKTVADLFALVAEIKP